MGFRVQGNENESDDVIYDSTANKHDDVLGLLVKSLLP